MPHPSLPRALFAALRRLLPRRVHTPRRTADSRVRRLTPAQREALARNLRRMLVPKSA